MEKIFKNYEILNAIEAFKELVAIKLPTKVSWNVTKNVKKIESSFKDYLECENEILKKYALTDENGNLRLDEQNQPKFPPNNIDKYNKERNELLQCEDTIDILTINLSDLEGKNISAATLLNLEFMIIEDTE